MASWLAAVLIINNTLPMAPWTLTLAFFGLLAVPGFALSRLLKINFPDALNQRMFRLTLGLMFALISSAIIMILGESIFVLAWAYQIAIVALLLGAFILDMRRQEEKPTVSWNWRNLLNLNNLGYFMVMIVAAVVVVGVGIQGSLFRGGDANFHLAIFRKAFEGSSLSPAALSFIKSNEIHVAYGLPLWHIFLGLITRLVNSDVFLVWKTISIPLSILAILVWYWLAKTIFQNRFLAFVSLAIFLNYIFNWNTGYLFTVLPFPDTLNNYLLMPLAVALFLQYIFSESKSKFGDLKILGVLVIFAPLMANIHLTQYLYLLIMVGLFGFLWLAFFWRSPDFKKVLTRIGLALAAGLIFFLPILVYIEVKSRVLTKTVMALWHAKSNLVLRYVAFDKINYFGKWALMLAIPTLIFVRYYRAVLLLSVMYLFLVLTFIPAVGHFLMRILGYIFANRIFGSVVWHFLVLGLVYGFLALMLDRALSLLPRIWRWGANSLLALGLVILIWGQIKFQAAAKAYEWLFSNPVDDWFNQYYLWVIAALTLGTMAILIWQWKRPKSQAFFTFLEPRNGLMASALLIGLMVILFGTTYSYGWDYTKMTLKRPYIFLPVTYQDFRSGESHFVNIVKSIGGAQTMAYIQKNLPVKSVFLVPGGVVDTLPTLLDQYMIEYPKKKDLLKTQEIYKEKNKIGINEAITLLKKEKVQYILLTDAPDQNQAFFDRYPAHFQKIFPASAADGEGDSVIYKVIP